MNKDEIAELILRRRKQILVHSIIYYEFDESIISDSQWSEWALELENLQKQYPSIAESVDYSDAFRDFDHSTGCNLPLKDPYCTRLALLLIDYIKKERLKNE